jgi:serine/threonine protein phosphatase PrpC
MFPPRCVAALNKANQDCFLVCRNFMRDPNRALFSVFDGHGREGDLCAQFARDLVSVEITSKYAIVRVSVDLVK